MSLEFLTQLLRSDNRVLTDPGQSCYICLQDCDTISEKSGIVECPIRLPCSHIIGSVCIVKWLHTNNTCPICRHSFFPAQPRPWEPDEFDFPEEPDEEEVAQRVVDICIDFGREMHLSPCMGYLVERMAVNVQSMNDLEGHTPRCAVAVTIYMVSHILNEIRSLDEISRVSNISTPHLREAYHLIYLCREYLIPLDLPAELADRSGDMSTVLALLPAPTPENGFYEEEKINLSGDVDCEEDDETCEENHFSIKDLCEIFCIELEYNRDVIVICQSMAGKVIGKCGQGRDYSRRIAAVCVLMVSHLTGFHSSMDFGTSVEIICDAVGASEVELGDDYATVYGWLTEIIDADMLDYVGHIDIQRALQAVPPLNWPAL